ncbi:hypothetical protein GCM10027271_30720 [Saccharopolyspora gloriosae]|uniref:Uncharacterized protein n=1 Tax=Saccharopolyspora gloriosae TaxID=455344 RepID=A0A840NIA8_9PSEU|nr:hypothetical protein [Saccharopolyspora gloriosae]
MSPEARPPTSGSAAPSAGEVAEKARQVHDRLGTVLGNLPGPGMVTDEECTRLAAALRGLAKTFDRHSPVCPAPAPLESESGSGGRAWVFPGQNR